MLRSYKNKNTKHILDSFRNIPQYYYAIAAVVLGVIVIVAIFWPRSVTFSYAAAKTCFYQPTLAPQLLRSSGEGFRLEADQSITLGGVVVAAMRMCVVPTESPKQGKVSAYLSLFGVPLRKVYSVTIPEAPELASRMVTHPVATSRPLMIRLSQPDVVHTYKISAGTTAGVCPLKATVLVCDVQKMQLDQGKEYDIRVEKYFNDQRVGIIASQKVRTLEATSIINTSIKADEVVYAKPTSMQLTTDKDIEVAELHLFRRDGEKRERVKLDTAIEGKTIKISWKDDLIRQSHYELEAERVVGKDGSGLDGLYKLAFKTSGGPKVKDVSVGAYKVPMGAVAILTFDQPIATDQDISQLIRVTGGAQIVGKDSQRITISLAGAPRCGDVSIKVTEGLKSSYGVTGGSEWGYTTRMICQVQGSLGSSVKGRSITSYSFGSGPSTVVFTGAIHGSEASTRALMLRWIDELEANVRSIPADKTVVVVPALNPDGIAAGSRTNANNVDLNRNFGTADWRSDITTTANTPFPGGGGVSALSEPESRSIANYIGKIRPKLVMSYHSVGGLLAANQAGDSRSRATTYASLTGYRNTTGSSDAFEYGISGTADDYYAEIYGVPSILVELGSHTDPQFARHQRAMWAMIR